MLCLVNSTFCISVVSVFASHTHSHWLVSSVKRLKTDVAMLSNNCLFDFEISRRTTVTLVFSKKLCMFDGKRFKPIDWRINLPVCKVLNQILIVVHSIRQSWFGYLLTVSINSVEVSSCVVLNSVVSAFLLRLYASLLESNLTLLLDYLQQVLTLAWRYDIFETAGVDVALSIVCDLMRKLIVLAWWNQGALRAPLLNQKLTL